MYLNNKRGLSEVVTTVIIVVLVLAAIGIVWSVVSNLITESTEDVSSSHQCLNVNVHAIAVTNTSTTSYDVTLERSSGGDATIGGVKMVLHNDTDSSSIIDVSGDIVQLGTKSVTDNTGPIGANKVDVTVYITDDSGAEKICPTTETFNF